MKIEKQQHVSHWSFYVLCVYRWNPTILQDFIQNKNNEYHSYSTRSAHHLHSPSVKLDLSKTGIKYRGTIVWNIIDESGINLEVSEAAFEKRLIKVINTDRL